MLVSQDFRATTHFIRFPLKYIISVFTKWPHVFYKWLLCNLVYIFWWVAKTDVFMSKGRTGLTKMTRTSYFVFGKNIARRKFIIAISSTKLWETVQTKLKNTHQSHLASFLKNRHSSAYFCSTLKLHSYAKCCEPSFC